MEFGSFLFAIVCFAMGAACCAMACFRSFPIRTITNGYDLYKRESLFSARNDIATDGQRSKTAV